MSLTGQQIEYLEIGGVFFRCLRPWLEAFNGQFTYASDCFPAVGAWLRSLLRLWRRCGLLRSENAV